MGFVIATYQVDLDKQSQFIVLMEKVENVMRSEGLITKRPAYRMKSKINPEMILEVFEWVNDEAFDKAQENPKILEFWEQFEKLWINGGFGVKELPEASMPWAQFTSI